MTTARLLSCFLVLAAAVGGCVVNNTTNGPPSLIVAWSTGGSTCSGLGIAAVQVRVERGPNQVQTVQVPCSAGQTELFVVAGTWAVVVVALDANGGQLAVSDPVTVTVASRGATTAPTVLLAIPTGALATAWTIAGQPAASGCASSGVTKVVVTVFDKAKNKALGSATAPCSAGQLTVTKLSASGAAVVQVDGYLAGDSDGSPTYGNPSPTGDFVIAPGTTAAVSAPIDLVKLAASRGRAGKGSVFAAWTILGEAPATACAKRGIAQVHVRVLDDKRAELASLAAPCASGNATIAGVGGGTRYLQLDASGPAAPASWGNVNLAGPFAVVDGQVARATKPIDIGQRTVVSLDWSLAGGATCAATGAATVFFEIRDAADKVVIPMSDPWAGKPCDLTSTAAYDARVLDFGYAKPQCAIPPGAKGLVICNLSGDSVGIVATAVSATGQPVLGGSMLVKPIGAGTHVALPVPLELKPCSGTACKKP